MMPSLGFLIDGGLMKIQMKVEVSSGTQTYEKGAIVELPAYKAEELILKGYAVTPPENKPVIDKSKRLRNNAGKFVKR